MRTSHAAALAATLLAVACSKADRQADALDNAANQADPAAADVMRNEADAIRDNGTAGDLSTPGAPVQDAMSNAGAAAAESKAAPGETDTAKPAPGTPVANTHAKPHKAGDPVPAPQR